MVDRVYERNASGAVPDAPVDPSVGYPSNGNPSQGVPATMPGEYWYYMITESLRKVIVDAGLVPDHLDVGLFASAIQQAFTNRLADSAQAQDQLNDTHALTPASLIAGVLGAGSLAPGYAAFPYRDASTGEMKRLIIQVGSATSESTVTFPIAFPVTTAPYVVATPYSVNEVASAVDASTATQFTWHSPASCRWVAIGY